MKRCFLVFMILVTLSACEKLQYNDEVGEAVVTGKAVASIKVFNVKDELLDKYEYSYDVDGKVIGVDYDGIYYNYQYNNADLVSVTCDSYASSRVLTYDDTSRLIAYSVYDKDGEFVIRYAFDYDDDRISCFNIQKNENSSVSEISMHYVWKDSNIHSIGSTELTYNKILNNFNVPIPGLSLPSNGLFIDPLFAGFGISRNMLHSSKSSSLREYSYQRNSEGDICRIDVNGGQLYYVIEY